MSGQSEEELLLGQELERLASDLQDADTEFFALEEELASRQAAEDRNVVIKRTLEESAEDVARAESEAAEAESVVADRRGDTIGRIYADLRAAEDKAAASTNFSDIWSDTVHANPLGGNTDGDSVSADELRQRLQAAVGQFDSETARVASIESEAAAAETNYDDSKNQAVIEAARKELDIELHRISVLHKTVDAIVSGQRHHLRRGTHLKSSTVSRRAKDEFLDLSHAKADHDRITAAICEEKYQRDQAVRDLKVAQSNLKHMLRVNASEKATLQNNLQALSDELEEADWEYQALTSENADLRDMRRNMIRTQGQVRQHLRQ